MRPLTQDQDIHNLDTTGTDHELDMARAQAAEAGTHSMTRRVIGSLRRAYREINDANAAVDRLNRPWVYQGRDTHSQRNSPRRASH